MRTIATIAVATVLSSWLATGTATAAQLEAGNVDAATEGAPLAAPSESAFSPGRTAEDDAAAGPQLAALTGFAAGSGNGPFIPDIQQRARLRAMVDLGLVTQAASFLAPAGGTPSAFGWVDAMLARSTPGDGHGRSGALAHGGRGGHGGHLARSSLSFSQGRWFQGSPLAAYLDSGSGATAYKRQQQALLTGERRRPASQDDVDKVVVYGNAPPSGAIGTILELMRMLSDGVRSALFALDLPVGPGSEREAGATVH